jgi:polar amino acid transport system substrate-binding protein
MRKILIVMLVAAMALSLVACANNTKEEPAQSSAAQTSEAVATEAPAASDSAPASEAPSTADESWTKIQEKGSFTLGFDAGFAPMGYKDENGDFVGFDIDLAKEVASRLNLEIVFQPIDWDSKVLELNAGNIDMIWNGLTITDERKKETLFSDPYMDNRQIIVVKADSGIKSKADLAGKTVAAQVESSAMEAIRADTAVMDTFGDLIESPDYVQALTELKNGTVDAVVVDEMTGRYYVLKDDPDSYVILDDNFGEEQYGIGFRMNDNAFRDKIQETLDAVIADGTAAQISQKWFGSNVIISK